MTEKDLMHFALLTDAHRSATLFFKILVSRNVHLGEEESMMALTVSHEPADCAE